MPDKTATPIEFLQGLSEAEDFIPPDQQMQYISLVDEALHDTKALVIQMEGGLGKTLAYLIAAMHCAIRRQLPVVVATSSISNRNQILDDLQKIIRYAKQIGSPLAEIPFINYRSTQDYASLARVNQLLERLVEAGQRGLGAEKSAIGQVIAIRDALIAAETDPSQSTLIDDLLPNDIVAHGNVVVTRHDISHTFAGPQSAELANDRARLNELMQRPAVILTTHAMVAISRNLRFACESNMLAAVILDECDRLTSLDYITRTVLRLPDLAALIDGFGGYGLPTQNARTALRSLNKAVEAAHIKPNDGFIMLVRAKLGDRICDAVFDALRRLFDQLDALTKDYDKLDVPIRNGSDEIRDRTFQQNVDQMLGGLARLVESYLASFNSRFDTIENSNFRMYVEWRGGEAEIHGLSATPGRMLVWLLGTDIPVIMTTAMLGEMRTFVAAVGMRRDKLHPASTNIAVHRFGRMKFTYFANLPPAIIEQSVSPNHIEAVSRIIRHYYEPNERMLVLTPGYNDIHMICEALEGLNYRLFAHHRNSNITKLRRDFVETPGILLTVIWEGFNIVRPSSKQTERRGLIDKLVITRLPFLQPHPMLVDLLEHCYGNGAGSWFWLNSLEQVTRRTHQGICRGVRGPNDQCEVILCDKRIPPPRVLLDEEPLLSIVPRHAPIGRAVPARFAHDISNFNLVDFDSL